MAGRSQLFPQCAEPLLLSRLQSTAFAFSFLSPLLSGRKALAIQLGVGSGMPNLGVRTLFCRSR